LRKEIDGVYLGDSANEAVESVVALLETLSVSRLKPSSALHTLPLRAGHTQVADMPRQLDSEAQ